MSSEAAQPILHHLNVSSEYFVFKRQANMHQNSQSQRIIWLLEELAIPYQLRLYTRQTTGADQGRAPPELTNIHPLGKSPILVTSDGRTITESSTIALYLIKTYDTAGKFQSGDWVREDSLCSFAGASMGPIGMLKLMLDIAVEQTPYLARPLVRLITGGVDKAFSGPEMRKSCEYLESELKDDYFTGNEPGRADFALSWPFDMMEQRKWIDVSEFPKLMAWRKRCQERPAWKRGLEKGNGYDLVNF